MQPKCNQPGQKEIRKELGAWSNMLSRSKCLFHLACACARLPLIRPIRFIFLKAERQRIFGCPVRPQRRKRDQLVVCRLIIDGNNNGWSSRANRWKDKFAPTLIELLPWPLSNCILLPPPRQLSTSRGCVNHLISRVLCAAYRSRSFQLSPGLKRR